MLVAATLVIASQSGYTVNWNMVEPVTKESAKKLNIRIVERVKCKIEYELMLIGRTRRNANGGKVKSTLKFSNGAVEFSAMEGPIIRGIPFLVCIFTRVKNMFDTQCCRPWNLSNVVFSTKICRKCSDSLFRVSIKREIRCCYTKR